MKKIDGVKAGYSFFFIPQAGFGNVIKTLYLYFKIPIYLSGRGGVFLSWIRIEPYTEIHKIAVENGLLRKDTDLLPEDVKELKKLFYTKSSYRCLDYFIIYLIKFIDKVLKPFAKFVLRRH